MDVVFDYNNLEEQFSQAESKVSLLKHIYANIRYRPFHIDQMILDSEDIYDFYKLAIAYTPHPKQTLPNMLLHGPPGCGKTTFAAILCRDFFGSYDARLQETNVLRLNAGDERTLESVRKRILPFVQANLDGTTQQRFVILDEADNLTVPAQSAIRKMMEDYAYDVCFIIIANNASKILDAVRSRCRSFSFPNLTKKTTLLFIERVLKTWDDSIGPTNVITHDVCRKNKHLRQYTNLYISSLHHHFCKDDSYTTKMVDATNGDARIIYAQICIDSIAHLKDKDLWPSNDVNSKSFELPSIEDARTLLKFYFLNGERQKMQHQDDQSRMDWFRVAFIFTRLFQNNQIFDDRFRNKLWNIITDAAEYHLLPRGETVSPLFVKQNILFENLLHDLSDLEYTIHTERDISCHITWFGKLYPNQPTPHNEK